MTLNQILALSTLLSPFPSQAAEQLWTCQTQDGFAVQVEYESNDEPYRSDYILKLSDSMCTFLEMTDCPFEAEVLTIKADDWVEGPYAPVDSKEIQSQLNQAKHIVQTISTRVYEPEKVSMVILHSKGPGMIVRSFKTFSIGPMRPHGPKNQPWKEWYFNANECAFSPQAIH